MIKKMLLIVFIISLSGCYKMLEEGQTVKLYGGSEVREWKNVTKIRQLDNGYVFITETGNRVKVTGTIVIE